MSHYQNFSAGDAGKQTARVFKKMVDHKFLSVSNADSTWLLLAQGKSPKARHLISTNLKLYYVCACLSNPRDVLGRNIDRTQAWCWLGDGDKIDPKCVTSYFHHKTSHSRFDVMLSGFETIFLTLPGKCHIFLELAQFDNFVTLSHCREKFATPPWLRNSLT